MNPLEPRIKDDYIFRTHDGDFVPGLGHGGNVKGRKKGNGLAWRRSLRVLRPVEGAKLGASGLNYRQTHQVLTSLDDPFYKSFPKKEPGEKIVEREFSLVGVCQPGAVLFQLAPAYAVH